MVEIIPNWHPIFVHFTVALLSVAALLRLGALIVGNDVLCEQWCIVARWNLWIGSGFVVLTVATGVIAYNSVAHDAPSHLAMNEHRNWALVTATLFLAITAWLTMLTRAGKAGGGLFVAVLLMATMLLGTTAWHGGELVYRYGLGVMSLPNAEFRDDGHGNIAPADEGHHDDGSKKHEHMH